MLFEYIRVGILTYGILMNIRITFDKEKQGQCMLSSGILIDIQNSLDKEK